MDDGCVGLIDTLWDDVGVDGTVGCWYWCRGEIKKSKNHLHYHYKVLA